MASDEAANALGEALAAVMLPVAQERVASTAPTTEMVDLVMDLGDLSRFLVEHTRRVMSGEPAQGWGEVADVLNAVAEACRRLVVFDADRRPMTESTMTESTMTKIQIQEGLRAGADAWFVVRVDTQGDRDLSQDDLHVCTDPTDAERLAEIERDNHGLPPSRQVGPGQPPLIYPDTAVTLGAHGTLASFSRAVELCVGAELRRLAEQPAEPTRDLLAARAAWLRRT